MRGVSPDSTQNCRTDSTIARQIEEMFEWCKRVLTPYIDQLICGNCQINLNA